MKGIIRARWWWLPPYPTTITTAFKLQSWREMKSNWKFREKIYYVKHWIKLLYALVRLPKPVRHFLFMVVLWIGCQWRGVGRNNGRLFYFEINVEDSWIRQQFWIVVVPQNRNLPQVVRNTPKYQVYRINSKVLRDSKSLDLSCASIERVLGVIARWELGCLVSCQ